MAKPIEKPVNEYVERVVEARSSDRAIFHASFSPWQIPHTTVQECIVEVRL